jgi:hypothetical protein
MIISIRSIRNVAVAILLASAVVGVQRHVFAASCQSWTGDWDFIDLYSCGPYLYDTDAIPDMHGIANSYATSYAWGDGVYCDPYWYSRLGSLEDPAYYDSAWPTCPGTDCGSSCSW